MTAYTWIGGTGDWNVAANWSPSGGPPKATDSATISATGAAYTVTINSADVSEIADREQRQRDYRRHWLADPQRDLHPQRWNFHSRLGRKAAGRHDEACGRNLRLRRRHAQRRDLRRHARSVGLGAMSTLPAARWSTTPPARARGRSTTPAMAANFILTTRRRSTTRRSISAARLAAFSTKMN